MADPSSPTASEDVQEERPVTEEPGTMDEEAEPMTDAADLLGDDEQPEEEEEGEDLVGDDMMDDYEARPHLDKYEEEGLDDEEGQAPLDAEARMQAEREMERRDRREGVLGGRRLPSALADLDAEDDDFHRPRRRRRVETREAAMPTGDGEPDGAPTGEEGAEVEEEEEEDDGPLEREKGALREWLSQDHTRRRIERTFRNFLRTFQDRGVGPYVYLDRIEAMARENKESLEVSYVHLSYSSSQMAVWTADAPAIMFEIMDRVADELVLELYPEYRNMVKGSVHVRVTDVPITDSIRDIRKIYLDGLIKVVGVVTRRTGVFPQLMQVKYDCVKCGFVMGPFFQNTSTEIKVGSCPECQSKGPFTVNTEQTIYRNYQKITLQESPGSVPAGRLPRHKDVICLHDLIDKARPGEEIEVTGIYTNNFDASLNTRNGFPVFATVIEANYISSKEDRYSAYKLNEDDMAEIRELAKDPRIGHRIVKSIAPSIYGHENIKAALALSMFGGQEKNVHGKHRLRGDINVLLMGDPGTAKSQFLKYVERTAERAVYTTGKGATAVGLTAAVHRDPLTREWTLEGGALVLADRGTCLIDEFDKMNDQDRVSIHEAMEQQSISISKAGIVTSLQARCAVIAAANPVGGRYDSSKTFAQNVELTDPILSRFDILCVVKDTVDAARDEQLARFVVDSHCRSHPDVVDSHVDEPQQELEEDIIPQETLRKYITYARTHVRPKLQYMDQDKITRLYADLRRESMVRQGIPIAVRHIESIIRMSEASASMHLREYVNEGDVDLAIRVLLESFISTQKFSMQRQLRKKFGRYLIDKASYNTLLMDMLKDVVRDRHQWEEMMGNRRGPITSVTIQLEDLEHKAQEYGITDLDAFYKSPFVNSNGFHIDLEQRLITKQLV
eukprot:jgi/Mesvir1/15303/Mv06512-RA.1